MSYTKGQRAFVKEGWALNHDEAKTESGAKSAEIEIQAVLGDVYDVKDLATGKVSQKVDGKYLFPTKEAAEQSETNTNRNHK